MARSRTETRLAHRVTPVEAESAPETLEPERVSDLGRAPETVLVEEPLEIRVDGTTVATTMRTPGHDFELAVGWCHAEGLLDGVELRGIRYCATGSAVDTDFNVVTVDTSGRGRPVEPRLNPMTSSCGICGTDTVDRLLERLDRLPVGAPLSAGVLSSVTERVAAGQELFRSTGGSHAAALVSPEGRTCVVREDIGRHNAVDKAVGRMALDGDLPATGSILWISGRASLEMVQKAWAAGVAALVSVSAPSSLAVRTAERAGMVLIGFARDGRFTVYAGADRVLAGSEVGIATRCVSEDPYI